MFQLKRAEKKRLQEYANYRMEQLKEFAPVLEFFESEHKLESYIDGLNNVLQELEGKNDNHTMLDNVFYLTPSIFFEDLNAIVQGKELPLPEDVLEIPKYLAEKERQKQEAEAKRQAEQRAQESLAMQEKWRKEDLERKERKRAEICEQLGIGPKALAKLQEE